MTETGVTQIDREEGGRGTTRPEGGVRVPPMIGPRRGERARGRRRAKGGEEVGLRSERFPA